MHASGGVDEEREEQASAFASELLAPAAVLAREVSPAPSLAAVSAVVHLARRLAPVSALCRLPRRRRAPTRRRASDLPDAHPEPLSHAGADPLQVNTILDV